MNVLYQIGSKWSEWQGLFRLGRYGESVRVLESALNLAERYELISEIPRLLLCIAASFQAAGDNKKALSALLRIRDIGGNYVDCYLESHIQRLAFFVMLEECSGLGDLEGR